MSYSQEVQISHQNGRLRLTPILFAVNNQVYSPVLSDGTGVRQLYIDQTRIFLMPQIID